LLWIIAPLVLLGLCVLIVVIRRQARRTRKTRLIPRRDLTAATPRDRLVALSETIRDDLTTRFGTSWRAKTTEELSGDGQLEQLLGPELFAELIRFLDQIDRLKFARARTNHQHELLEQEIVIWEPMVANLRGKIHEQPKRPARTNNARSRNSDRGPRSEGKAEGR
jgi:hypothetical protein